MDTFSAELAAPAIENNIHDLYRFVARQGEKTLVVEDDFSWVAARPSWPCFMFDPNFTTDTVSQRLEYIAQEAKAYRIPPALSFGPKAKPANLADILKNSGFECFLNQPGMAVDLAVIEEGFRSPADLSIKVAGTRSSIADWIALRPGHFDVDLLERLMADARFRLYLGVLDDRIVARSFLFLSAGVAGIYHVFVAPEFRGQGIGTTVTLAQLRDAREQGCRIGVLTASPLGEPIYRRIGFKAFYRHTWFYPKGISFVDYIRH